MTNLSSIKKPYSDADLNELHAVACDVNEHECTRANAIQCMSIIGTASQDVEFMPHAEIITTYFKGDLIER